MVEKFAEGAGHQSRELMSPDYRALLQAFLRGERPPGVVVQLPPVPFIGEPSASDLADAVGVPDGEPSGDAADDEAGGSDR